MIVVGALIVVILFLVIFPAPKSRGKRSGGVMCGPGGSRRRRR